MGKALLKRRPFVKSHNEPVSFKCRCSRDRFAGVLMTLREDDKSLLEDETTELVCHYCNEKYHFSKKN